jgi:hypothetical protein
MRQAHIQHDKRLRWVAQFPWAWVAFALVIIINIYTIFSINGLKNVATVLGFVHIFISVMMTWAYILNVLPIDIEWYNASETSQPSHTLEIRRWMRMWKRVKFYIRFITFWSRSRLIYDIGYLIVSIIGVSVSLRFFAFHLFDITLRVKTLGFVIQAIFTNILKLGAAFLLLFLMIYAYMLIGQSAFEGLYVFGAGNVECNSKAS